MPSNQHAMQAKAAQRQESRGIPGGGEQEDGMMAIMGKFGSFWRTTSGLASGGIS